MSNQVLVEEYVNYAEAITFKIIKAMNFPLEQKDELLASAYVGLVEAASRFDPSKNVDFKYYSYPRIKGAIIDYIRSSVSLVSNSYYYLKSQKEMMFAEKETSYSKTSSNPFITGGLNIRVGNGEEGERLSCLPSRKKNPYDEAEKKELSERLTQLINKLPCKEKHIIIEHYTKGKSFIEISKQSNSMSKSWVSRLHKRALNNLKQMYVNELS